MRSLADPSNCWPQGVRDVANAIAASAAFLRITGDADAETAAAKIYEYEHTEPNDPKGFTIPELANLKGWALVMSPRDNPFAKRRRRTDVFQSFGSVVMRLERGYTWTGFDTVYGENYGPEYRAVEKTDPTNTFRAREQRYSENRFGDVLDDIETYFAQNGGVWLREMIVEHNYTTDDKQSNKAQAYIDGVQVRFNWGID